MTHAPAGPAITETPEARLARLAPFCRPGAMYAAAVARIVADAETERPTTAEVSARRLAEAEVFAGLRPVADLAALRAGEPIGDCAEIPECGRVRCREWMRPKVNAEGVVTGWASRCYCGGRPVSATAAWRSGAVRAIPGVIRLARTAE